MLNFDNIASLMLRNLLKSPLRQRRTEGKITLNQITFEDSKPSLSEPILGDHVAIQWSLTLERGQKFNRVKSLKVILKLENASDFVKIFKMIPEDLQEEKATIQIGAGISVADIGASIPVAKNIIATKKTESDEVEWLFEEVEFRGGNEVIIEGAIELAFFSGSEGRLVSPTIFADAIFEKRSFASVTKEEIEIPLNSEVGHINGLKPTPADAQQLTGSKAKELFSAADIVYYNPNGSTTSENRKKINDKFAELARNARNLNLLFYTGNPIFSNVTSPMYDILLGKIDGTVQVLLLDPEATDIVEERYKAGNFPSRGAYMAEIQSSIDFCKNSRHIECKLFKEYSPWRLVIADNKEVYVQYYMPDRKGDDSPMYGFDASSDTSLGRAFINYFDTLFKKSRPA